MGVGLVRLPATFDLYLAGRDRQAIRTNRRHADKAGYRYVHVSPEGYLEDIVDINRSAPVRQGKPMKDAYVDREQVARSFADHDRIHAIVDADGHLRAYAVTLDLGDCVVISMILGHADALEHGVMYLLVSEVVRSTMDARRADGSPHWLMYDTFWGAAPGLAYFKQRLGFEPFTVKWVWADRPTPAAAAPVRSLADD